LKYAACCNTSDYATSQKPDVQPLSLYCCRVTAEASKFILVTLYYKCLSSYSYKKEFTSHSLNQSGFAAAQDQSLQNEFLVIILSVLWKLIFKMKTFQQQQTSTGLFGLRQDLASFHSLLDDNGARYDVY